MSKKQVKKQLKNVHRCLKHLSVIVGHTCSVSPTPSKCLLLGNAGHANGIGRADVMSLLQSYLPSQSYRLHFPPDKQFSVLFTQELCPNIADKINMCKIKENVVYCVYISEQISFEVAQEKKPPGLSVHSEVLSEELEQGLISYFLEDSKRRTLSQDQLKNRVTLHYGYKFDYKTNLVDLNAPLEDPIPDCVQEVMTLISPHISITPNQLTVNIYQPGQGIPKHVDTHSIFTSEILSVSLGSDVVMEFKNPSTGDVLPVLLPRRSLTVMAGEARYLWHHGITPRKSDALQDVVERGLRVSLTLRECTPEPCTCDYPSQCDSRNYGKPRYEVVGAGDAARLEREYVSAVYEEIATHFSGTRHSPWPGVVRFLNTLPSGALVADVGCGNGKYLGVRGDVWALGNDNSYNLCAICRERGHEVFACNALNIPLRRGTCDAVICIAMLHHLTTRARRLAVLQNLAELLVPGGRGLVTVWAQEQHLDLEPEPCRPSNTDSTEQGVGRRHFQAQDVFVDWQLKTGEQKENKKEGSREEEGRKKDGREEGCRKEDGRKEDGRKEESRKEEGRKEDGRKEKEDGRKEEGRKLLYRYYHVFKEGELSELVQEVPQLKITDITYDKANWCATFTRVS